ncbi:MAG: DUF1320 domain-containing protein [Rhodospirillales bacterium]|nr:DUF1320 domain-containing protein [Rhodospirillales bacterium]
MAYCTQQNLIDRFGDIEMKQIADRDGDDVLDAAQVTAAIDDGAVEIDAYLAKVYALPLSTIPAILEQLNCHLARYALHKDDPTEVVVNNRRDAIRTLDKIAKGTIVLEVAGVEPTSDGGGVQTSGPDRVFTHGTLADL